MYTYVAICDILHCIPRFNCQTIIETCAMAPSKKHVHLPNISSNAGSFVIFMAKAVKLLQKESLVIYFAFQGFDVEDTKVLINFGTCSDVQR